MSTPRTEAARALVMIATTQSIHLGHLPESLDRIVARIEAEARRQVMEQIRTELDKDPGEWVVDEYGRVMPEGRLRGILDAVVRDTEDGER